ncbi:MAG: cache domain-containing protein [Candidatus Cloacimonadota bacterium]|nr:cache domain-containing protein [Candidatus Cloacimonadota bacterium]
MKKTIIPFIIIVFCFNLFAESGTTSESIDEKLNEQSTYAGSALASREDRIKYGSPLEAKIMVEDAVSYMKEVDLEKAFLEFGEKDGRFHIKDLYLFVIDMDGNVLFHGGEESLIGTNMIDLKDSAGKYFIKDFIKLMEESNNGWKEYYWRNYETQKVEMKLTYLVKFNKDIFIGCGAYQPRY